ncbi:hypothetical protein VTO42DRAFT_7134 [Malbranchea cinnamomea]
MWSFLRGSLSAALVTLNLATLRFDSFKGSPGFNVSEATIETVHDALYSGQASCRDIVSAFLSQIETYNPVINAVLSLNPHALAIADEIDAMLRAGGASGPFLCVPVLLKDNFDAVGMNTTAGCRALANIQPREDAPVVKAFKDAGAVILGKTNLHELALEGLSVSSLGGQTLNPYDLTRTPGGSSGGTGSAIAASFAVLGTGTDTMNSLRNPASANSLYSVRPTRGLISRKGVIPVSYTQDAVGPIARSLKDLSVALAVMTSVGYDPGDNTTALPPPATRHLNYLPHLYRKKDVSRLRLGVIEGFFNRSLDAETAPVNIAMDKIVSKLEAAGATIISITDPVYDSPTILSKLDVQAFEFEESINSYLTHYNSSLSSIYASTNSDSNYDPISSKGDFLVIPRQYPLIASALSPSFSPASPGYAARRLAIQDLSLHLKKTFEMHSLDALIYPQQQNLVVKTGSPSQIRRNGILAAVTGNPVITIPAGFSPPTVDAPVGVPIGMEILGREWDEAGLLEVAAAIETVMGKVRRAPVLEGLNKRGKRKVNWKRSSRYDTVPEIVPDISGISEVYPLGRLE